MQSETGFPSSHQLKSYVASKSRLKLSARCPVSGCWPSCLVLLLVAKSNRYELLFDFDQLTYIVVKIRQCRLCAIVLTRELRLQKIIT